MKNSRFRFETERLRSGSMTYEVDEPAATFNLEEDPEYRFLEPVTGELKLSMVGDTVLMMGKVKTVATAACARCLEDLRVPLNANITLTFMEDPRLLEPEKYPELVDDDIHWYDGEAIYPADQIRELLLLELPSVPACELEPDDTCPVRGVKVGPLTFGPSEAETLDDAPAEDAPETEEEQKTWKSQMRRLRRDLGE